MILNRRGMQYSKNHPEGSQVRYGLAEGRETRSAAVVNGWRMGWFLPYSSKMGLSAENCG